jgi:hypothetical protein
LSIEARQQQRGSATQASLRADRAGRPVGRLLSSKPCSPERAAIHFAKERGGSEPRLVVVTFDDAHTRRRF